MADRGWMYSLCGDEARVPVATPFTAEINGEKWDCATNGQAMVLMRGEAFGARESAPHVAAVVPDRAADPVACALDRLMAWITPEIVHTSDECADCEGTGNVECSYGYDHECDSCDGTGEAGETRYFPPTAGAILGVTVNRRLLHAYLAQIPFTENDSEIFITSPDRWEGPIRIDGDGWIVVCTGMRHEGEIDVFQPREKVA